MTQTGPTTTTVTNPGTTTIVTPPLKPGYRTTEALFTILLAVGVIAASAADWLPPRYAAMASAVATGAYALSRGLAKVYPPKSGA